MNAAPQQIKTPENRLTMTAEDPDGCVWCGLPVAKGASIRRKESRIAGKTGDAGWFTDSHSAPSIARDKSPVYCCYGCRVAHAITQEKGSEGAVRWTIVRLGLSIFFTMNLMAFTMTMWSLDVYDVQPDPFQQKLFEVFRWLSMVFAFPVLLLLGLPLLQSAVESWKQRIYSTDLLVATGVLAAYLTSAAAVVQGESGVYFEVGAMVLLAVTLGRWFEAVGRQKATQELDKLVALLPATVCRVSDEGDQHVSSASVIVGDQLRVCTGDRFPVDGLIVKGRTSVDEQVFTGESTPVERQAGDSVLAGTVNLDGDVLIRTTAEFRSGSFGRLLKLLQEARTARGHYQRLADRVSRWFFPAVTVIAMLVLCWYMPEGFGTAIQHSLSVLLIACPCALGLATPLAVWTALSTAIRHQVLFRSGEAIERLAGAEAICLDKTGTLTTGMPQVSAVRCEDSDVLTGPFRDVILRMSSASRHPFSTAISEYIRNENVQCAGELEFGNDANQSHVRLESTRSVSGAGVEGIAEDGRRFRLGLMPWVCGVPHAASADGSEEKCNNELLNESLQAADADGCSITGFGVDGQLLASFMMSESVRPEVPLLLRECSELRLPVTILTGDRRARSERLQAELSQVSAMADSECSRDSSVSIQTVPIPRVVSELRPEDKVGLLKKIRSETGRTIMVGDGINDAPAISASDVGIAMGCGADVARDSAHVCLLGNDLSRIPWAIRLARQTRTVIRQNLFWAFGYNSVGVIVAAMGYLNPAIAAGLMIVSSLLVISNSLRLMAFESDEDAKGLRQPLNTEWQPLLPERISREGVAV